MSLIEVSLQLVLQVGCFFELIAVRNGEDKLTKHVCVGSGRQKNPPLRTFADVEFTADSLTLITGPESGGFSFQTCYGLGATFASFGAISISASSVDGDEDQGGAGHERATMQHVAFSLCTL